MKRSELFGMVWKEPLATLAPKLGMSTPTLLKLCRMHNVPVPGRGHWAKVRAGKSVQSVGLQGDADVALEVKAQKIPVLPLRDAELVTKRERKSNVCVDQSADAAGFECLLELGLRECQSAAKNAYLLNLFISTTEASSSMAESVRRWVSLHMR